MKIILNSHVSALPCCFALPSGSSLSAVKFDCSTPSATRITPKDNQCIFEGIGCKVWMSGQDHVSKLFGSTFQQLTRSGFIGDAKTNAECVPASQKSIPIFACKVVLDLWANKLQTLGVSWAGTRCRFVWVWARTFRMAAAPTTSTLSNLEPQSGIGQESTTFGTCCTELLSQYTMWIILKTKFLPSRHATSRGRPPKVP